MGEVDRAVLFTTGDDRHRLLAVETGFRGHLDGKLPLEVRHLGRVESLLTAYHRAALEVEGDDTLLLFCHQDARPLLAPMPPGTPPLDLSLPHGAEWLRPAIDRPDGWVEIALRLAKRGDTGFLGVAGALGLLPGLPWWSYPDLTGAVLHRTAEGEVKLNPYGRYGRAAVLDGICLMIRRGAYAGLPPPPREMTGFHYYDIELCTRAHHAGLKNWTVPLLLVHEHGGAASDDQEFQEDMKQFQSVYGGVLPFSVPAEQLPRE